MKTLSALNADAAQSLLDYKVIDKSGSEIGSVHSLWADTKAGNLEFIGVKTGWVFGHNHVVPVDKVEIDEADQTVHVPYDEEFIKGAPSFDASAEISDAQEENIYRYYGGQKTGYAQEFAAGGSRQASAETTAAAGSYAASSTGTASGEVKRSAAADKDTIEVALTEEQVRVGKRTVAAGQVRLRKIVRTETVNQPVEVRHEDVVIERVSADQVHKGTAASDFTEEVIDVPLTREEVVVQKDAHVTGAVRVSKTAETETQTVSETVHKEDVEVLRDGKVVTERK